MRTFCVLILILSPILGRSQQNRIDLRRNTSLVFYDENTERFVIIDDSTSYLTYHTESKKWESFRFKNLSGIPFSELSGYIPLSKKGNPVYFIVPGCGIVLKWCDNTIKRVDKSFNHLNQLGGTFFQYDGRTFVLGGYGLFTFKNIITFFDSTAGEWFKLRTKGIAPPPIQLASGMICNDILYVFNGYDMSYDAKPVKLSFVYALNLKTMTWTKLGRLNKQIQCSSMEFNAAREFELQKNDFFVSNNRIIRYNFRKNVFVSYQLNANGYLKLILERNGIYLLKFQNTNTKNYSVFIDDGKFLKSLKKSSGEIIDDPKIWNPTTGFIFLVLILILIVSIAFFSFRSVIFRRKKLQNPLSIELHTDNLLYAGLTEIETKLFLIFVEHPIDGIELSDINDLVNFGRPSADTLKKRRELLLKDLKLKLSKKFDIPFDRVIYESPFHLDKRVKILKLNPDIYSIVIAKSAHEIH